MGAAPYFQSGGFRRDQLNHAGVYLVDLDGNPYVAGAGGGGGGGLAQLQLREGAVWVNAPGSTTKGLLIEQSEGMAADAAGGLPTKLHVLAGYDGANVRSIKTDAGGILQVDVNEQQPVELAAATLAALETVQIGSLPAVALDAATLAALETIQVGSLPAVDLTAASLAALETISVANFPASQNVKGVTAADAAIASEPVTVGGRVSNAVPAAMSADGDVGNAWLDRRGAQVVRERTRVGRSRVVIKFHAAAPATADTLLSIVKQTNGVDAGGTPSIAVAAGKILVIEAMYVGVRATAAAAAFMEATLRSNPAGATVIGSPSVVRVPVGVTGAVIGSAMGQPVPLPGGLEFTGAETLGVSSTAQATTNQLSITLVGYEYDA